MGKITWQGNSGIYRLHPRFWSKVKPWVAELSHNVYVVNNGSWRSHWRQFVLWFQYVTGRRSIPANFPGTSAHNRAGKAWAIDVHPEDPADGYDEMHAKALAHGMHFASNEKWHLVNDGMKVVPKWVAVVGFMLWLLVVSIIMGWIAIKGIRMIRRKGVK